MVHFPVIKGDKLMTKCTLTVLDTTGIQNYIFGSNNLQHNVGASGLVHCATHDWVFEKLIDLKKTNVKNNGDIDAKAAIENGSLNSELIYSGGGNAVIIFSENESAIEFTKRLTCKILSEAPGLQLVASHMDFNWDKKNSLKETILNTTRNVNKKKHNRNISNPVLGLGVTADCQYTGLPAVDIRQESESNLEKEVRISSEVAAKWKFFKSANKRLHDKFPIDDLKYISNFNDFGTKHESSYIAVVHTDGNNMGERVWNIANQYSTDNREYINKIRAFSESVEKQTKKALKTSIVHLTKSIDDDNKIEGVIEIRDNKLPFRPIVFGGDDVTFVCDGRLGLTLTEYYLRKLTSNDSKLSDGKPISARAGIAIVKSHYPFSRAVNLADNLAKSAKNYIKEQQKKQSYDNDISAIDWHFAASGPIGDIDDIRGREYTGQFDPKSKLYMRPLRLGESVGSDWHSWDTFTFIIEEFKDNWSDKRNKLMSLREALRAGPETVKQFVTAYKPHKLPGISNNSASSSTGWVDGECTQCTCFDAIEAMDFFIPLKGDGGK